MQQVLTKTKKSIVLLGGGHSHIEVIRQLAVNPIANVQVTLVSEDLQTPYSGMLPGLIAGHYNFNECHINLAALCQWAKVAFIQASATAIDADNNAVSCSNGNTVSYHVLSINTGSQPNLNNIFGANFGHPVKPIKLFIADWESWLASQRGNNSLMPSLAVVGGGAAGIEVILAIKQRLKTLKIDAKLSLICGANRLLASHNKRVQKQFEKHFAAESIAVYYNSIVTSATASAIIVNNEKELLSDFTVWAVNAQAKPWLANTSLACNGDGFINIEPTLCSISHSNVFAAGDTINFVSQTLPKAGVYAVRQGPVLSNNIRSLIEPTKTKMQIYTPQQQFLSLLTTGGKHAILSRGLLCLSGSWVWHWKNKIDSDFVKRFMPPNKNN
jgi:pyridine nucleotide-disulfide oxidoreductase family protein